MSDFPAPPPPPPPPPMPPQGPLGPPPGYVAYGSPGAVSNFARIAGLTRWLNILLIATAVITALTLITQLTIVGRAQDYVDGISTEDAFRDRLGLFLAVGLLGAAITIAQLVVLCVWTFRLAKNMQALGRQGASLSQPGITVAINILGGCTLGILNFFMWREIWKGSDPETPAGDPSWKSRAVDVIVPTWLALTLASSLASLGMGFSRVATGGVGGSGSTNDIADQLTDQLPFVMFSGLLGLGAAIAFIILVRRLAVRHMQATHESG